MSHAETGTILHQRRKPLAAYPLQLGLALGLGQHPVCDVDENLRDGDHVGPLQVLNLPGHTPGSLAFHWPEKRLAIVGDVVVTWPDLEPGWSGFTLDFKKSHESLGKLSDLGDVEVVGVGHGEPIASGGAAVVHGLLAESERRA